MGCGASKFNEDAVKAEFAVTPSSCGDVWPGLDRSGFAEGEPIVFLVKEAKKSVVNSVDQEFNSNGKKEKKSEPGDLMGLTEVIDKNSGNVLFKVKGIHDGLDAWPANWDKSEVLEFFDTAGRLVALRGERQDNGAGSAWWLMWSVRPAVENQKSGKTHDGMPLYQWGMFRWGRTGVGSLVQYDEIMSAEDPRFKRKEPHVGGSAMLAFEHRNSSNSVVIVYGSGKEKGPKDKDKWLHGKPMAIFRNKPISITMAPAADAILLFVAAECNNWLDALDKLDLYRY